MAFGAAIQRPAAGDKIRVRHVTDIHDVLTGVSGYGQSIQLTEVNDNSLYALDVRQKSSVGPLFRVRDEADVVLLEAGRTGVTLGRKLVMTGLGTLAAAANLIDVSATWSAAEVYKALAVAITNGGVHADSRLEEYKVNGAAVWAVDLAGMLQNGNVPGGRVTGTVPDSTLLGGESKLTIRDYTLLLNLPTMFAPSVHAHTTTANGGVLGLVREFHPDLGRARMVDNIFQCELGWPYFSNRFPTGTIWGLNFWCEIGTDGPNGAGTVGLWNYSDGAWVGSSYDIGKNSQPNPRVVQNVQVALVNGKTYGWRGVVDGVAPYKSVNLQGLVVGYWTI